MTMFFKNVKIKKKTPLRLKKKMKINVIKRTIDHHHKRL